jgi:hypothetical protein
VSWLIESPAYLLSPDDVVLFAWWVEITMPHMQRVHAIDSSMIERARALRRAADRILAVSQLRQGLAETISAEQSSGQSIGLPQAITAKEAAEILGVDPRTIYRIKAQLGVLRERPLMLSHDVVIRYKITRPDKRSRAAA